MVTAKMILTEIRFSKLLSAQNLGTLKKGCSEKGNNISE